MGTKHKNCLCAAAALLAFAMTMPVTAGPLDTAKELYGAGKYAECAKTLEKDAVRPDAPLEMQVLFMRANMRAGNAISATTAAAQILKQMKKPTLDILFDAAESARLAGEDTVALSRYLAFCNHPDAEKDKRFMTAAAYLTARGAYPEVFLKYAKAMGAVAMRMDVRGYFTDLIRARDNTSIARFIPGYMALYKDDQAMLDFLGTNLYHNANNLGAGQLGVVNALLDSGMPLPYLAGGYIVRAYDVCKVSNSERYRMGGRYVEKTGMIPGDEGVYILPAIQYIASIEDDVPKTAAAKTFFANYKYLLKSKDAGAISKFILYVGNADKKAFSFVKPEIMAKLYRRLHELRYKPYTAANMGPEYDAIIYKLFANDQVKQVRFLKDILTTLPGNSSDARYLFRTDITGSAAGAKDSNIRIWLESVAGNNKEKERVAVVYSLAELQTNKFMTKFYRGVTDTVALGDYDVGTLMASIAGVNAKAASSVKAVMDGVKISGSNEKNKQLIAAMARINTMKEDPGFAALEKFNGKGSNPVFAASSAVLAIGYNTKRLKDMDSAVERFVSAYKGKLPASFDQISNLEQLAAWKVFYLSLRYHGLRDGAYIQRNLKRWLPKIDAYGDPLCAALDAAGWHDEHLTRKWVDGLYVNTVKALAPLLAKAPKDVPHFPYSGYLCNRTMNKPNSNQSVLVPIYARFPQISLAYLGVNVLTMSPDYLIKQYEAILNSGSEYLKTDYVYGMAGVLRARAAKDKYNVPLSFVKNHLAKYMELCKKENTLSVAGEMEVMSTASAADRQALLEFYITQVAKRTNNDRFLTYQTLLTARGSWNAAIICTVLEKGVRAHLIDNGFIKNPTGMVMSNNALFEAVNQVLGNKEATQPQKDSVKIIAQEFQDALLARDIISRFESWSYLAPRLEGFLDRKNADALLTGSATMVIAETLKRATNAWYATQSVDRVYKTITDRAAPQTKYVFLTSVSGGTADFNVEMKNKYLSEISKLSKDIPGIVPVPKTDPAYNLFVAVNQKKDGNALHAWSMIRDRFPLLTQRWKEFEFEFVLWALDMARTQKMYKEAATLAQTLWLDEGRLSPEYAAQLALIKGDIYRDEKNYPIARLEYESLNNSKRCNQTPAGRMAKFRLVELLILTEDFGSARTMLERLTDSNTLVDQAEAYYLLAKLEFASDSYEQTNEFLKEVFQRVYNHVEGRLLEATVKLKMGRVEDDEVAIGTQKLAKIQVPGRPLILQIVDQNLGVIRGGKSLPVLVTTTNGKDREIISLLPSASDMNKFTANVPTALGRAVPNNGQIELNGSDTIEYQIDPEFQKANNIVRGKNVKIICSSAKLYAGAQLAGNDETQEELRFQREMAMTTGAAFREFGKVIRPGNTIYIRVNDPDMSMHSNKRDTIKVDLTCNSGDQLLGFELTETGACTGVFEGKVPTAIPFPNVTVSSAPEGQDVNAVINSTKNTTWTSNAAEKGMQWIEVDTMSSHQLKQMNITLPNVESVKSLRFYGSLDSGDELLCAYPVTADDKIRGGLTVRTVDNPTGAYRQNLAGLFKKAGDGVWVANPVSYRSISKSRFRDRNGLVATEISGYFYVPENMTAELKFLQQANDGQTCQVVIDKKLVMSSRMNAAGIMSTKLVQLQKGIHHLAVYALDSAKNSSVQLGMLQADGSEVPLPAAWFDASKHPELMEYLRPKGKITKTANGFRVDMETDARFRRFRWQFDEFVGRQIEVSKISATNLEDEAILPVEHDLSTGKNNQTLEIAPADTITVRYHDERRIEEDKAILADTLSSSFVNATVAFEYEEVFLDEEGVPHSEMKSAVRVSKNDTVTVSVYDPDSDQSEDQETVDVEIVTSSGEKITMKLLETTDSYSRGRFSDILKFGDVSDGSKNTIKLQMGDTVTARFLDKENNSPGIPVHRTAFLENSVTNRVSVNVYSAKPEMIEDRSVAARAKIKMMRDKGDKREDIKIFKEVISVTPIKQDPKAKDAPAIANTKAPLLFDVLAPDFAKHSGSVLNVEILTMTELNAAKTEGRDPKPLTVKLRLQQLSQLARTKGYQTVFNGINDRQNLERGVFTGIVRLQLGSAGDEVNDVVASNETYNLLNVGNNTDPDAFRIPTVIVSGTDTLSIICKGEDGKVLAKQDVQLRSDGELGLYDKAYLTPNHSVHLGQNFYVQVYDPDCDVTAERDNVTVKVAAKTGDKIDLVLSETLPHSGIFSGSMKVDVKPKPLTGETEPKKLENNILWTSFGDKVTFTYTDEKPLAGNKAIAHTKEGEVVIGSDGEVAVFTKKFKDPEMAVKTNFLMAEALFEMAKSHRNMRDEEKEKQAQEEIAKGKRVLEEALRDYPDTALKAQGDFLLANLAQQLENYNDAIGLYSSVLARYPDSEYAVKSQFQKAVCLEKLGQFIPACEEYVKLTYLYPNDKLAADAKLRLANHYYKQKNYKSSASIFRKFAEHHPDHPLASKGLMLAGYSAVKFEELKIKTAEAMKTKYRPDYTTACKIFQDLIDNFPDDKQMRPEAMYWLGDLWFKIGGDKAAKSYQMLQNLVWDYPETRWAKLARGRLAERQE